MKRPSSRVLSLLLALVLSFSLCPAALADLDPSDYSDLKEDYWAYDSIMYCSEWEIVKGYDDGKFYPENPVSGVEFVTMVTRTFYEDEVAAAQSEKPADSPWYWANTKIAADHFLTNGMTIDGSAMNRYDMANVAKNALITINKGFLPDSGVHWGLDPRLDNVPSQVKDWDSVPKNRTVAIKTCYATGVLTGMSDGMFHGEKGMTRAQACVVITRMLNVINSETPGVPSEPQQPVQPETPAQPETPQPDGSGLLANGQDATVENVQAILAEIEEEYPEGTVWGTHDTPNTNYYADGDKLSDARSLIGTWANTTYACGGWATMVSNRIFGMTGAPTREVTDITKARPGDIVIKMYADGSGVGHVGIFLQYVPANTPWPDGSISPKPGFVTCDGNLGGVNNRPGGTVTWYMPNTLYNGLDDIGTRIRIYTRYPD